MMVYCIVCGMDWDIFDGSPDMIPWQWEQMQCGAGCPDCEGIPPDNDPEKIEKRLSRAFYAELTDGSDETTYMDRILAVAAGKQPPLWERPADPIFFACDGCSASVVGDLEDPEVADWSRETRKRWHNPYMTPSDMERFIDDRPWESSEDLATWQRDGKSYCPQCAEHCGDCGELLLRDHDWSAPTQPDDYRDPHYVCETCYTAHYTNCELCDSIRDVRESEYCENCFVTCDTCDAVILEKDRCDWAHNCADCCDCETPDGPVCNA